jgi:hypothetical protein
MTAASLGRIAFAAHSKALFLSEGFTEAKAWDVLSPTEKAAWDAAADAVLDDINVDAPRGRCSQCFTAMMPTKNRPEVACCPVHSPEQF